jgi:hypothetical protein
MTCWSSLVIGFVCGGFVTVIVVFVLMALAHNYQIGEDR